MKRMILCWVIASLIIGLSGFVRSDLFSDSEKILAKVGEKVITQNDLDEFMRKYETIKKGEPFSVEEKRHYLNTLIQNTVVATEAEREKLDERPEVQLKLRTYKNEILANEYITTKVAPLITVTDAEVEEVLKSNPNLIPRERLTLKEIQVKTEKEAEEVYQELKKGADFSKMVAERSMAPSKMKGGLIGPISKGYLPQPLEVAVFGLKEGEFSKPIESADGFRIFYLVNRKEIDPEQLKRLEEKLREKIIQLEKNKKIGAVIEKKVEELKKEIKVEAYPDRLK